MDAVADILLEFIHALTHHVVASRVVTRKATTRPPTTHVLYGARVDAHDADTSVCAYVERAFESLRQGVSSGDVHAIGVLVRDDGGEVAESFEFSLDVAKPSPAPTEENKRAVRSALSTLATWFVLGIDSLATSSPIPVGNARRSFEIIARAASARCPEDTWRAEDGDGEDGVCVVKNGHVVKTKRVQNAVFTIDVRCTMSRVM